MHYPPYKPHQCSIYKEASRRTPVYASLQTYLLQIVYPCGFPLFASREA
jgi:hypothetical protein